MTTSHVFYIPLILLVGFIVGIIVGRKSVVAAQEEEARLAARREARRRRDVEPNESEGKKE
jgi:hypothetical protein